MDVFPDIVGLELIVIGYVTEHPTLFVQVMIVFPAATPVNTPELVIVAFAGVEDTQGLLVAAVGLPVSVTVPPTQTALFPDTVGFEFTVIVIVTEQPLLLVQVTIVVPAETAVTKPVFEIVATEVLLDDQALLDAAVPEPVSCNVNPTQTDVFPVIVGLANTVTGVNTEQPRLFV